MMITPVYDINLNDNIYTSFDQFEDKKLRKKFIVKTLFTFSISLFTTLGLCIAFKNIPNMDLFIKSELGEALYIISFSVTIFTMFICLCCDSLLRKTPSKFIIYILFILSISYSLGITSIFIKSNILYTSIILTTGITTCLILYSFISSKDFNDYITYLFVIFSSLILIGIVNIFFQNTIIEIIISGGLAIIFACFIVYDMQMIIGQKHIKYKYNINDYIFAAMSLYLDVINMFIYTIQLLTLTTSD